MIKFSSGSNDGDYEEKPFEVFELTYSNRVIADDKPKDIKLKLKLDKNEVEKDRKGDGELIKWLVSKKPELDKKTKTYRLDFKGRAQLPSTSNLQLVLDGDSDSAVPVFQLGKLDKNEFAMDFSYPLTFFTAFGMALAALSRG